MWNQMLVRIGNALERLAEAILSVVPALVVLVASIIVGALVGLGIRALLGLVFRLRSGEKPPSAAHGWLRAGGVRTDPRALAGAISFWSAVVVALVLGVNALEPGALKSAMTEVVGFVPRLLIASLVFLIGLGAAGLVRRSVLLAAVNAGVPWARVASRGLHLIVLAFFAAIALGHLGVGHAILVATYSIVTGGVVLALALAFGLGARDIARRYLERKLRTEVDDSGIRHV